jgi:hypothetical protein
VVTFCDLTTSVDGVLTDAHARIAEILDRYEPGDPVHLAVSASAPGCWLPSAVLSPAWRLRGRCFSRGRGLGSR